MTEERKDFEQKDQQPEKVSLLREIWEWVKILVIAAVAAYLLNNFVIANSTIPTGSMQNTIMAGDRVFGSRLEYTFGEVERGDVAIFIYGYQCRNCGEDYREQEDGLCPNCGQADKKNKVIYYVKRVIGMPGDHIEIKYTEDQDASAFQDPIRSALAGSSLPTGDLYVNGELVEEDYLPEPMLVGTINGMTFPEIDVTVPEGSYFMLGDNRNNSMDARFWTDNMFVKKERMLAKVYVRYWPLTEIGLIE